MRREFSLRVEAGRCREGAYASDPGQTYGAFLLHGPCGAPLKILACNADDPSVHGWEHVSVSCERRTPNWLEMSWVKNLFWTEEETVVQFHPRRSVYVNCHPYCLHLWRRVEGFPEPPPELVGLS